jgi:hypothetical protein
MEVIFACFLRGYEPYVTLLPTAKAGGFFRLSSVVDGRSNAAWLRLGAHRSGGGKARHESLHSDLSWLGGARARSGFHAWRKGMNGPHLAVGSLESQTKDHPRLFRDFFLGNVPTRLEAFPALFFCKRQHAPQSRGLATRAFAPQIS